MNIKKLLLAVVFLNTATTMFAQGVLISGRLKSAQGERVELAQVPIRLVPLEDKQRTHTFITDSLGRFKVEATQGQSYELLIATITIDTVKLRLNHIRESLDLGDIPVKQRTSALKEVVVNAPQSNISRIDKQIFYPTASQLNGASNAVDVLGNMMIQGLYIDPSQNHISTERQGKLLVRINGAPASQKDYLRISPKQIKRIEYHDFPSMRYGDAEAVVDIVLKEPLHGTSVTWDARSAFHTLWGDVYGDMSYAWKRSEVGVSISGTAHSYKKQYTQAEEHYRFSPTQSIDREIKGIPSPFREDYATIILRYGYTEPDKQLLSAKLLYDYWREKTVDQSTVLDHINGMQPAQGLSRDQKKHYREFKPSFDLYYQRQFGQDILALNVVGSSFSSSTANKLIERYEQHIQKELSTTIDGSRYSIIGDVFWQNKIKAGQLITGVNFSMGSNHNKLNAVGIPSQESKLNNYNTYAYAQWRGTYKKLAYGLGLGYTLYLQEQENAPTNKSHFVTPQLNLSFPLGKKLQARYSSSLRIQRFSTGETNQVEYPVDTYIIHRGNSSLKPYNQLINQLALTFSPNPYRFSLSIFDSYARGGIMERYQAEGDKIVRQLINADKYHQLHLSLGASSTFFEGKLSIGLGTGVRIMQAKSASYNHQRTAFSYNANIAYNHKQWRYWANYRSNQANLNGESYYQGNGLLNIGVDYRKERYKIGIGYINSARSFTSQKEYLADSYHTLTRSFNETFRNTIYISLSIRLHSGKRYEEGDRYLYNSDSDSGTLK